MYSTIYDSSYNTGNAKLVREINIQECSANEVQFPQEHLKVLVLFQ